MDERETDDEAQIRALIARQFSSLSWKAGGEPDWLAFRKDFLPEARLLPSARPVALQSVEGFVARMSGLVGTALRSFDERVLGSTIQIFGNVAVAAVGCENVENDSQTNRVVEMMLLVKDEGGWKIAAQAWDKASDALPVPPHLL